jgi:hypothetical protein
VNAALCLQWCVDYAHRFPQDLRTALHVRDWLADKAAEEAQTDSQRAAVQLARDQANALINTTRTPE